MRLKYGSKRTYSALWNETFSSKAEARRGDELWLLQMAGEITDLQRQVKFVLSEKPKISLSVDFVYTEAGKQVYEDSKSGVLTREFRVKLAWLKEKFWIDVKLTK